MSHAKAIVEELKQESANTRIVLERIPEDKFSWTPHEKSMTCGQLGSHLAESFQWLTPIIDADEFSMDMENYKPYAAPNREELLRAFDKNLEAACAAVGGVSEDALMKTWRMKVDGKTVIEMPRMAVLRMMGLSHMIHHRGQLTVYLRLCGAPLPALYGPTADEPGA